MLASSFCAREAEACNGAVRMLRQVYAQPRQHLQLLPSLLSCRSAAPTLSIPIVFLFLQLMHYSA